MEFFFCFFLTFFSFFRNHTLLSHCLIPSFLLGGRSAQEQIPGLCVGAPWSPQGSAYVTFQSLLLLLPPLGGCLVCLHLLHFPSFQLLINPSLLNKAERKELERSLGTTRGVERGCSAPSEVQGALMWTSPGARKSSFFLAWVMGSP